MCICVYIMCIVRILAQDYDLRFQKLDALGMMQVGTSPMQTCPFSGSPFVDDVFLPGEITKKVLVYTYTHWIGLRENLQETMVLPSNIGLSCKFSPNPIPWYTVPTWCQSPKGVVLIWQDARKTESAYYSADPSLQLHVAPKGTKFPHAHGSNVCQL